MSEGDSPSSNDSISIEDQQAQSLDLDNALRFLVLSGYDSTYTQKIQTDYQTLNNSLFKSSRLGSRKNQNQQLTPQQELAVSSTRLTAPLPVPASNKPVLVDRRSLLKNKSFAIPHLMNEQGEIQKKPKVEKKQRKIEPVQPVVKVPQKKVQVEVIKPVYTAAEQQQMSQIQAVLNQQMKTMVNLKKQIEEKRALISNGNKSVVKMEKELTDQIKSNSFLKDKKIDLKQNQQIVQLIHKINQVEQDIVETEIESEQLKKQIQKQTKENAECVKRTEIAEQSQLMLQTQVQILNQKLEKYKENFEADTEFVHIMCQGEVERIIGTSIICIFDKETALEQKINKETNQEIEQENVQIENKEQQEVIVL
ncbi:Hypothetical_protein [Hexamita inflata]|uniref:Hypothetical_protein n=1 Tax=Hexamita inflata TaxID=28002 RepID=A0AA86UFZ9_9EUKA|nr:Hypothetical protein HINF_LOCUS44325 [Hexamita inflata]